MTTIFDLGAVADGADRIIGGTGSSRVRYSGRTRPVKVTVDFGGADDGEASEGDEIIGSHEGVDGSQAGDSIQAPLGSSKGYNFLAGGGNDLLVGADGPDTLSGGPGGDSLDARRGDDRLFARDGEGDTVGCGDGVDTIEVDAIDNFGFCENGTIGLLRLAPKALRARAGAVAHLRLSWRHPRSWERLRQVTLRLHHGRSTLGEVTIIPRAKRIRARGGATVVRRATRLSSARRTVTARLALRFDRRLAGRTLRLAVEAEDVRGLRQLVRRAGSIRVAGRGGPQ